MTIIACGEQFCENRRQPYFLFGLQLKYSLLPNKNKLQHLQELGLIGMWFLIQHFHWTPWFKMVAKLWP